MRGIGIGGGASSLSSIVHPQDQLIELNSSVAGHYVGAASVFVEGKEDNNNTLDMPTTDR